MNRTFFFAGMLALAACAGVFAPGAVSAQNAGQAVLDYGTRVNIEPGYETSLDLSYFQDPNTYSMKMPLPGPWLGYPVWSPKGDRIFYTDFYHIYSVPVTGGKPRLEYDGNLLYPYHGRRYVLNQSILPLTGLSPDGKKLYFSQRLIGEGSGAQITIQEVIDKDGKLIGWGSSGTGGYTALRRLDLETGTVTTLANNVVESSLSRSGRYLEYLNRDTKTVQVLNLETGEEWSLQIFTYSAGFADNDQNLLYLVPTDGMGKFFKIPVRGGEPREVVALSANTEKISYPVYVDCTPEGAWVIYSFYTGETVTGASTGGGFTKFVQKLRLSNISTGKTMETVPFSKVIDVYWPRFSPDGKQICYILNNFEKNEYALYIKDMSPLLSSGSTITLVNDAPQGFALTGNYPNPFNPATTISFSLAAPGIASLAVYDITGRKVRDLAGGFMSAGLHSAVWNGRDDRGIPAASGIYFARLEAGGKTLTSRMILLK